VVLGALAVWAGPRVVDFVDSKTLVDLRRTHLAFAIVAAAIAIVRPVTRIRAGS
jgi:hypothetical protein